MSTDDSNQSDSIQHKCVFITSNPFFILGLLFLLFAEVSLIHKLWIKPKYPVDLLSAIVLHIAFLMPFLAISALWYRIDKQTNKEEISPSFAESINMGLLMLLMIVYIAFTLFLNYVGR
jgi:hypothetical protein